MKETVLVTWVDAEKELPDSDTTVLIHCAVADDPVWLGYHDGSRWHSITGEEIDDDLVDDWAELPSPPRTKTLQQGKPS